MNPPKRRSLTRFRLNCWHGTERDIQRLVDLFADLHAEAEKLVVESYAAQREADKRYHEKRVEEAIKPLKEKLDEIDIDYLRSLLRAEEPSYMRISENQDIEDLKPKMHVIYKELETKDTGSPEDVMSRLHLPQVRAVTMEYGRTWNQQHNGMRIELMPGGADVSIAGEEFFVNAAVNRIKTVLKQQKPRAWWLREPWFLIPFAVVTSLFGMTIVVNAIGTNVSTGISLLVGIFGGLLFYAQWYGIRWLVPNFELIPDGKKSRSQWALGVIGAIIISLAAGGILTALGQG